MCLDTIKEHYDTPSMVITDGWKRFSGNTHYDTAKYGDLKFSNNPLNGIHSVPLDKWIKADPSFIETTDKQEYYTGFHVYTDEKEAKSRIGTVRRVYIRQVTVLGRQSNLDVVIAQEMYVPSDPNSWPPQSNKIKEPEPIKKKKSVKETIFGKPGNA